MNSLIGWLDHSEEDQRRVREMLRLQSDSGTVDDLGIGTVRDAISNRLFPGVSVIHTRARYFLFVPWIYRYVEQSHPRNVIAKGRDLERRLIPALKAGGDETGLIGRRAGKEVNTLPSEIYWAALARLGIFLRPGLSRRQYGRAVGSVTTAVDMEDEVAERARAFWHQEMPEPPSDFFSFDRVDFQMSDAEADWLCERIFSTETERGTNLLGCLVRNVRRDPSLELGSEVWSTPLPPDANDEIADLIHHAQHFGCAAEGASLLYNLMLAEQRRGDGDQDRIDAFRARLIDWAERATSIEIEFWAGEIAEFWKAATGAATVPHRTRSFVDQWAAILAASALDHLADNAAARGLIRERELAHKRGQARFANEKRLANWNGSSGTGSLGYRWPQVHRLLTDLAAGLRSTEGDLHAGA